MALGPLGTGKDGKGVGDSVTVQDLSGLMRSEHPLQLLDVRRMADRQKDPHMLPGAEWRDPENVSTWAQDLVGKEAIVYCVRGGSVSRSVADALSQKGIAVRFLEGGLEAWRKAGKPVR